jgi:hypothetical protein
MKFRNTWITPKKKQWDKLIVRIRLGAIDFFSAEIDIDREFYSLTILNFTVKNR